MLFEQILQNRCLRPTRRERRQSVTAANRPDFRANPDFGQWAGMEQAQDFIREREPIGHLRRKRTVGSENGKLCVLAVEWTQMMPARASNQVRLGQ